MSVVFYFIAEGGDYMGNAIPFLVDRKAVCRLLGGISLSHLYRLEKMGVLGDAKIHVGIRMVRYNSLKIMRLVESGVLSNQISKDGIAA